MMAPGDHGSTFAGNPLVCHAACAVFDIINTPGERARPVCPPCHSGSAARAPAPGTHGKLVSSALGCPPCQPPPDICLAAACMLCCCGTKRQPLWALEPPPS